MQKTEIATPLQHTMISLNTLRYLSGQKRKDAETLLRNGRHAGAVYLMGYVLEFALKRKLSMTLGFTQGFPQNPAEFQAYNQQISRFQALNTGIPLSNIRHLRVHQLETLLALSGAEYRITTHYPAEWQVVKQWNPEQRYVRQRVSHHRSKEFLRAARRILREIS